MLAEPLERIAPKPIGVEQGPEQRRRPRWTLRLRPRARLAWLGVAVLVLCCLCLGQQAAVVESTYQVERLRAELEALDQQILRLTLEKAQLSSLARIEQVARTQLGMVEAGPVRVVRVAPLGPDPDAMPVMAQAEPREGSWWDRVLARILPGAGVAKALSGQSP